MDNFVNLAKQGIDAYQRSQSDVSKTGGHELNRPASENQAHGGKGYDFDDDDVVRKASSQSSGDSSLFSTALSFINSNKGKHEEPIDEEDVTKTHKKVYDDDDTSDVNAKSLGSAAALQVFKQFVGGGSSHGASASSSGGKSSQSELIAAAMSEASKLFDKKGSSAASGDKQDAVNGAAMTVVKLLVQSKLSGGGSSSTVGGGNSGGLSQLLSLASQFAK
ncbi:hypothetical protein HDZ31DRAFT_79636 [Schizophyllum fasciatum]